MATMQLRVIYDTDGNLVLFDRETDDEIYRPNDDPCGEVATVLLDIHLPDPSPRTVSVTIPQQAVEGSDQIATVTIE